MTRLLRFVPLLLVLPPGLGAQVVPADTGTLVIRRNGVVVAEESFEIRRDGANVVVTSTTRWDAAPRVVLAVFSPRRVTVRVSGAGGETAREFPTGGTMLMDDSSFVFLLLLSQHAPGQVRIARPRETGRGSGILTVAEGEGPERMIQLETDGTTVRAWFDPEGRFVRAEIPGRNISIRRADRT